MCVPAEQQQQPAAAARPAAASAGAEAAPAASASAAANAGNAAAAEGRGSRFEELRARDSGRRRSDGAGAKPKRAAFTDVVRLPGHFTLL